MRRAMMTLAGKMCLSKKFKNDELEWVGANFLGTRIDGPLKSMYACNKDVR